MLLNLLILELVVEVFPIYRLQMEKVLDLE
jgi:hypothetical protein